MGKSSMEAQGRLHTKFDTQQVTERFRKREFVLTLGEDTRYPQTVLFQFTGDRCDGLDEFGVGDEVRVEFDLRGREWTSPKGETRFFNSLEVWRMERVSAGASAQAGDEPPLPDEPPPELEDVPF